METSNSKVSKCNTVSILFHGFTLSIERLWDKTFPGPGMRMTESIAMANTSKHAIDPEAIFCVLFQHALSVLALVSVPKFHSGITKLNISEQNLLKLVKAQYFIFKLYFLNQFQ